MIDLSKKLYCYFEYALHGNDIDIHMDPLIATELMHYVINGYIPIYFLLSMESNGKKKKQECYEGMGQTWGSTVDLNSLVFQRNTTTTKNII